MPRLTKRDVEAFKCPSNLSSTMLWDSELKGFGVRAFPSGAKKFIVQYRTRGGKQRRMTIGPYGALSVERARELAKSCLGKVAEGSDPAGDRKSDREALTVAGLCDLYLSAVDAGLVLGRKGSAKKASTVYTDRGRIERHIKPLLGNRKVGDVRQPDVESLKNSIATGRTSADVKTKARGRAIVKGGTGTATRTLGLFGSIFQWAVANGHAENNPVRGVRRFADQQRKALLEAEDYLALGEALAELQQAKTPAGQPSYHLYGLSCIWFIALTGLRRGEAINLRWSEVDFAASMLRLGDTKTGESLRPLGRSAADLLRDLPKVSEFVFPGRPGGTPYAGVPKLWLRVRDRALSKLSENRTPPGLTLHALRHSYAGTAESLGGSLPTIAALLGHRLGGVTAGYVLKRVDRPLIAFADRVSGYIHDAMCGSGGERKVVALPAAR